MRPRLFILLIFFSSFSFAQQPLTTEQINRLADAGKIYGYVKYFHPFVQYKNINWDSAFAANVEGIIKAKDKDEYAQVLQNLFSCLDDGITTIVHVPGEATTYKAQELSYQIKDSLLYIQMNDAPFMTTDERFYNAIQNIPKVKGAVIDMRRPANSQYYYNMPSGKGYFDWSTSWFKGNFIIPSLRTVSYNAFPSEDCQGCSNAAFKENAVSSITGELSREMPCVFIVSNEYEIPLIAVKLQEQGKAKILQEEGRTLLPGTSVYFYITDGLLIQVRTGEAINVDGSLLLVHPNAIFKHGENIEIVTAMAKRMLETGNQQIQEQQSSHPMLTEHLFSFTNDSAYPSTGYRMLAAAKMFTIINHFYANRSSMSNNWEEAYKAVIPNFINAKDSVQYWKAVAELHAVIKDSHGFVSKSDERFSLRLNPVIQDRGRFKPPVFTRMIENKIVVTDVANDSVCKKIGIGKGDIIISIDGNYPMQMIEAARKYQNAGNTESQNFYLSSFILFGHKEEIKKLKVQNPQGKTKEVMMPMLDEFKGNWMADKYVSGIFSQNHQAVVKMLTKDIGYADLTSRLNKANGDSVIKMLESSKGFILDMRGYPQSTDNFIGKLFELRGYKINPEVTKKLLGDMPASSPRVIEVNRFGILPSKEESYTQYLRNDKKTNLPVKLVVLTNGLAQSSAEHWTFSFKNICDATIVGSPTAGANSFFVNYFIPGSIRLWLSGMPIDRAGIQPDILVYPTVKGFQAGKDEVLERAIKFLQTGK